MRGIKIPLLVYRAKKHKIKIRYLVAAAALLTISPTWQKAQATGCPDLRVVFARGSGGELNRDANYLDFKNNIEERISGTGINYEFIDLFTRHESEKLINLVNKQVINCLFGEKKVFINLCFSEKQYYYLDIGHLDNCIFMSDLIICFVNKPQLINA